MYGRKGILSQEYSMIPRVPQPPLDTLCGYHGVFLFQITYGPSYPRVPFVSSDRYPRVGDLYWVTDRAIPGIPLVVWLSGSIFSHTGIRYLLRHIPSTFPRGAHTGYGLGCAVTFLLSLQHGICHPVGIGGMGDPTDTMSTGGSSGYLF